jgi:hypothetical protein
MMLSFEEFSEITACNEDNLSPEEADPSYQSVKKSQKEMSRDIENSPIKKSNSKKDVFEKSIEDTLKAYETPVNEKQRFSKQKNEKDVATKLDYKEDHQEMLKDSKSD